MITIRKLLSALSISLLITSCGGGGGGTPPSSGEQTPPPPPPPVTPLTEVPIGNVPDGLIHAPLTIREPAHEFYDVEVQADGRVTGIALLDASEEYRFFSTGPTDFTQPTFLTPTPLRKYDLSLPADRTVYIEDGVLFSKDSNAPTQLSGTEKVDRFWLSPDQNRILYIANVSYALVLDPITMISSFHRRNELYTVDLLGANRAKLSIANPGNVIYDTRDYTMDPHSQRPQFLPDMSRIVYILRSESTGLAELHSVLPDGTGRVVLNADIDTTNHEGNNSFVFSFTGNSSHIIYGVRNAELMELYSIKPDGTTNTKISGTLVSGGSVSARPHYFTVASSPDYSFVVFFGSAETVGINELYRVALDGTGLTKLSNGSNVLGAITIANNNTLVYFSDDLYAVSTAGGTPTKIANGFTPTRIFSLQMSPDKTAVVYVAYDDTSLQNRLLISKLDGSATINLSGPMVSQGHVSSLGTGFPYFILDPAGTRVAYRADADVRFRPELYSVNLDGTNRQKVSPPPTGTNSTLSYMSGFSSDKFYFTYNGAARRAGELYVYDYSTSTATNISASWPDSITEDITASETLIQSTNGAVQAFVSRKSTFNELSVIIRSPGASCRINIPDGAGVLGGRGNFIIEPTGNALYYTMNGIADNWQFIRAETSDCSTTNINSGISEGLQRMTLSPDGLKVAFSGNDGGLYITATDGSDIKEVNAARTMGGIEIINNGAFAVSHDSKSIVYWGIEDTVDVVELYYATLDGLSHGKINAPLVTDGEVFNDGFNFIPVISPDDQWVIYPARQDALVWELYKSKLDGSVNTRISGNLAGGEINIDNDENLLLVTPDSSKVVYQVEDRANNSIDLYAVNLNGSPVPVKLSPDFTNRGTVLDSRGIALTPDSNSVVYVSRESQEASNELFVVNLDGTGPNKLNAILSPNENVINFSLTKDGSKVVYLTGFQNNDLTGLHVSNIDGSAGNLLALPHPVNGNYSKTPPRLTNDNRLVFRATIDTVDGVYIMPVTGSTASLVVEIPKGRNLQEVYIVNNGQVMVVADLRLPGVFEVFNYNI